MKDTHERVGEVGYNNFGSRMTIVEYNNSRDITIVFDNGYIVKCEYGQFKKGSVRNAYDKSVFGVGYLGEGEYKATENGSITDEYSIWSNMLQRVYDDNYAKKNPTYIGCSVSDEWHNFQNFAKWYNENYYTVGDEKMCLDKDVLFKDNKIYSPNTCVFVPQSINKLLTKRNRERGQLPIGVTLHKVSHKYMAQCHDGFGERIRLGSFNTPKEAFYAYKKCKEGIINSVAERYKNYIPTNLYNTLITYEVEIDD